MKKLFLIVSLMLMLAGLGSAQIAVPVKKGATLPATCVVTDTQTLLFYKTGASNGLYYCSATNTWTKFAAGTFLVAPGSTTDNAIVRFDGTSGQIQNSPVTIDDTTGAIAGTQSVALSGSTSGSLVVRAPAAAGTNTLTLPAGTTNFSATGGTSQVVQQTTAGGALSVGQLAASNLSNGTTGSGSVVLATSPTLVTPALGTPSALVGTNITGTAASLTAGAATALAANPTDCSANNYATTIAASGNLTCAQVSLTAGVTGTLPVANGGTGVTTSTGSGNNVLSTSPTLVTPVLGVASATSINKVAITAPATSATLTIADGKTLTVSGDSAINGTAIVTTDILRSYLASTVTYNNTATLANTALSVTVVAGGIYDIEVVLHATSAVRGLNVDFDGTATATNFVGEWRYNLASGSDLFLEAFRITAMGTDMTTAVGYDGTSQFYIFKGTIEVNTGGTFLLRGAQRVADASNTTIQRGSTLRLTKMN